MVSQYKTLSMCIVHIQKCGITSPDVLRLETKLYRAKRFVLDDRVSFTIKGDVMNEAIFDELYTDIADVFRISELDTIGLAGLNKQVDFILENLFRLATDKHLDSARPDHSKRILVRFLDLSEAYVPCAELDRLIHAREIHGFKRSDGWVDPTRDLLRGQGKQTVHPFLERRSLR